MLLEYYAHSCFRLSAGGTRVLLDPYSPEVGYKLPGPGRGAELTLVSHDHFDHNHTAAVVGRTTVVRGGAPRTVGGISVRGVLADHDTLAGSRFGHVTCFCLELDGLRVCHLSDLGRPLSAAEVGEIGPVDLLLVPVGGGGYTLDGTAAASEVARLKPRWAVPMHYRTPFLNRALFPDLEPVDSFLRQAGKYQRLKESCLELSPGPAPGASEILLIPHMF